MKEINRGNTNKSIRLKDGIKGMSIEEVCEQFKNYIYKTCQSWSNKYELEDLHQVGFIGLKKAYDTYDIKNGTLFLTYAAFIISNELKMFNRKNSRHLKNISLNQDMQNEGLTLGDTIADDKDYESIAVKNMECEDLKHALETLRPRDKKIIEDIWFRNRNQREIAAELKLSQSYISRVADKALLKLKQIMEDGDMKITKKQLEEDVIEYGTDLKGITAIAEKYGMKAGTIRTYCCKMGITNKANKYKRGEKKETMNEYKESTITETEPIKKLECAEKPVLIKKTIYEGEVGKYEVGHSLIALNIANSLKITLSKENLSTLITELTELKGLV